MVHGGTHYAEAESSGFDWTPRVQYAATRPLEPTPSDDTKIVQCTAPSLQGQVVVDDSSVRLHDEEQAAADFFDHFSWKEVGLKHVPHGREETETARDGTRGPIVRRIEDGIPEPVREEPATANRSEEKKEVPRLQRRSMKQEFVGRYAFLARHTVKEEPCQ